jgi:hypothetical protein
VTLAIEVTPNGAQGDRSTHAAPVFAPLIEAIDWSRPAFELTEGVAFQAVSIGARLEASRSAENLLSWFFHVLCRIEKKSVIQFTPPSLAPSPL